MDQADKLRKMVSTENEKRPKVITVTSGKGGVGKSNFVVNLSIALQKRGNRVLIFDADVGMGNDDVLLGFTSKYSVFDVIRENKSIEEVVMEGPYGVKLLPGGSGLNKIDDISNKQRERFVKKIACLDSLDYIIMDTGAGINRNVLGFIACCDDLYVVVTPEPTSLTDAYSLLKVVSHFKIKKVAKVVINKTLETKDGTVTFSKLNNAVTNFLGLKLEHLGSISEDRKLVQAVRKQIPFITEYPNSQVSRDIEAIADKVLGSEKAQGTGASHFFKKLFSIFS